MKKLLKPQLALIALVSLCTLGSCSLKNHSEASVPYFVIADTIDHFVPADTVFDDFIRGALRKMEVTETVFSEFAESESSSVNNAIEKCNKMAYDRLKTQVQPITKHQVVTTMYAEYLDTLSKMGYKSLDDLNLSDFSAKMTIYNGFYTVAIPLDSKITKVFK